MFLLFSWEPLRDLRYRPLTYCFVPKHLKLNLCCSGLEQISDFELWLIALWPSFSENINVIQVFDLWSKARIQLLCVLMLSQNDVRHDVSRGKRQWEQELGQQELCKWCDSPANIFFKMSCLGVPILSYANVAPRSTIIQRGPSLWRHESGSFKSDNGKLTAMSPEWDPQKTHF